MEKTSSYQTLASITKSQNEDTTTKRIHVLEFNPTEKTFFIRRVGGPRALDNVYGKLQSPYKSIYGQYL
jgi:hypothetical protein